MMVLGIDSSTDRLAVGVASAGRIVAEETLATAREHASRIIGLIDTVLSEAGLAKTGIEGIAVATGPGSFTGLRIGMAVAKGMALALDVPIIGVSTFEVIARRLRSEYDEFCLAAVVRKGEFYLCRIHPQIDIRENIKLVDQDKLPEAVGSIPVGLVGRQPDGWAELPVEHIDSGKLSVSGGELAGLGAERMAGGETDDPATLEPLYVAPSQAERKFGQG